MLQATRLPLHVRGPLGDPCPPSVISHVGYDVHNKKDAARVFYLFVTLNNATIGRVKIETSLQEWSLLSMKTLSLILAMFFLLLSAVVARGANLTRVSNETG